MSGDERWLAAIWAVVQRRLPAAPARVLELGCGSLGGFVPQLRANGYAVVGVDPEAPAGEDYLRVEFEHADLPSTFDAVVASTSLHHVADPSVVIARIASLLPARGTVVVIEWASEDFDEPTARWCFDRLGPEEQGWLHRHHDEWTGTGKSWDTYMRAWVEQHGLHRAGALIQLLDQRFARQHFARGPYFFPELSQTSEEDEQAAIGAGQIRAARVEYVGSRR